MLIAIIPAKNEELNIGEVVSKTKKHVDLYLSLMMLPRTKLKKLRN